MPTPDLPEAPPRVRADEPRAPTRTDPTKPAYVVPPIRPVDDAFLLPAHRNKAERVSDHTKGLVDDVKTWVELRVELVKAEIEEQIDSRIGAIKGMAIVGFIAAVGAFWALITLSLGLGAAFGSYWLGFLAVTLLLFVGAALAKRKFAPGKIHVEHSKATGKIKISHEDTPAQKEAKQKGEPEPEPGELHSEAPDGRTHHDSN